MKMDNMNDCRLKTKMNGQGFFTCMPECKPVAAEICPCHTALSILLLVLISMIFSLGPDSINIWHSFADQQAPGRVAFQELGA